MSLPRHFTNPDAGSIGGAAMSAHGRDRGKSILEKARLPWGKGWFSLSDDMRDAFIAREILHCLMAQDDSIEKFSHAQELVAKCLRDTKRADGRA